MSLTLFTPDTELTRSQDVQREPAHAPAQSGASGAAWQAFDEQAQWKAFSHADAQGHWVSQVKVQGMHCSACAAIVEQRLAQVPGVVSAKVDGLTARAHIVWDEGRIKPSAWLAAVSEAGYALLPILDADAKEAARVAGRAMLWRWMVAGFCTMQVMMYAWPSYGAAPGDIDPTSDQLLRWASLLLTLPVIAFSCGPFFKAAWRDVVHGRISMDLPVSLGIGLTFFVSTAAVLEPQGMWGGHVYFDSLTMLVFFLLTGRWMELSLKQKLLGQLEQGVDLLPVSAQLLAGAGSGQGSGQGQGATKAVPVQSLSVGDVIHVRTGESFAADGLIVLGQSESEESALTGEAMPVSKALGDKVYAGTTNLSSPVHVQLTSVGTQTRLGQMNQLMQASLHTKPQIVQLADRIAKPFLLIVLLLAAAVMVYWWPIDPHRGVLAAAAVLIVTCPCALALAAPAAFLSSASALAKAGLLVRDMSALERLDGIDHMVFDKTGTLTQAALRVSSVRPGAGHSLSQVLCLAQALSRQSVHPVALAVHRYIEETAVPELEQIVPIEAQEIAGMGIQGVFRDSQGSSMTCKLGSERFCMIPAQAQVKDQRAVYLCNEQELLASFSLSEELRPDAATAIASLRQALHQRSPKMPSHLSMMSGDSPGSVNAIAAQLAWDGKRDQVLSQCTAQDKLHGLQALQAHGYRVAMMGDGVNDAPVLAAADVSFAPAQGAALASVQADFLLTANSLAPIAYARRKASQTMRVVRQNLTWALIYNLSCVPLALSGVLTPWMAGLGMALSSLVVLVNSLRLQRSES